MEDKWKRLFWGFNKADLVSFQVYALGIGSAFLMAKENTFWVGCIIAVIGLIANMAIPRIAVADAIIQSEKAKAAEAQTAST